MVVVVVVVVLMVRVLACLSLLGLGSVLARVVACLLCLLGFFFRLLCLPSFFCLGLIASVLPLRYFFAPFPFFLACSAPRVGYVAVLFVRFI